MVDQAQFDLSQIADVVNRSKISDKRKRNEMIRLGTSDPNSFAMQNQQQIQQAQQPTEFWGAGRKEASNQNPDVLAANLVGGIHNLGGDYFYYGDKDTSTAQLGTKGYQTTDLGGGKYDILGQDGTSIGQGYGSVEQAINSFRKSRYADDLNAYNKMMETWEPGPEFSDKPLAPVYQPYQSRAGGFGALEDWEVLGQLLSGTGKSSATNYQSPFMKSIMGRNSPYDNFTGSIRREVPGNKQTEVIKGLNTLFGSTPLLWNNTLQGYILDPTPADKSVVGYQNPYSVGRFDKEGRQQSAAQLSRVFNNPEQWQQLGRSLNQNQFFVPTENAAKLPGWKQQEYQDYKKASNGLFGTAFDFLDPILDKVDPLHNTGQDLAAKITGSDSQKEAFNKVAPIVASLFGGWGALANAANSASLGDMGGAALSALGGGMQLSGAGTPTSYLGNTFKDMGMNPQLAKAAANFSTQALSNAARGGDLKSALGSALFGAAGGAAGDALAQATEGTLGDIGSKMLGGAASGGINSLFSKNSPVAGSLYGAMSGGLHGFLNSTSKSGNQFNQKTDSENRDKAFALAKLFKHALKDKIK